MRTCGLWLIYKFKNCKKYNNNNSIGNSQAIALNKLKFI